MEAILSKVISGLFPIVGTLAGVFLGYILKEKSDNTALLKRVNAVKREVNYEMENNWRELEIFLSKMCGYQRGGFDLEVDPIKMNEFLIKDGIVRLPEWETKVWEDKRFLLIQGTKDDEFNRVGLYYRQLGKMREKLENPHERFQTGWIVKEILKNGKPILR